jgi:hypothetical protein
MSEEIWLMIAFAPQPGYRLSESGKSWWATYSTRGAAVEAKRRLVAAGIGYVCKKTPAKGSRKKRSAKPGTWRFKPWRQPKRPVESERLRSERDRRFAAYRQEMSRPLDELQELPVPYDGPSFGRSPGLSKAAPPRMRR